MVITVDYYYHYTSLHARNVKADTHAEFQMREVLNRILGASFQLSLNVNRHKKDYLLTLYRTIVKDARFAACFIILFVSFDFVF